MSNPVSRRAFLKAAGVGGVAAAMGVSAPAVSQGLTKVTFTTSWIPEGPNLFAYVARDKGFWKKHGLDVSVARGSGSGAAAQAVGAGSFMFGMGATPTVIAQAIKELPIACIGQINYDALMGIGVLSDSPIVKPKDLEGKKLGASVTSGEYPFLGLYAQKAGFDMSKVQIVQLDGKVRDRSLVEKLVDAVSAFGSSTIPSLAASGVNVRFMLFKAVGIDFYGQSLTTQPARVKSDPSLCEAFVSGAMDAIKFSMTNPDEALDIFLKANDEVSMSTTGKEYASIGLGLTNLTNLVPEVEQRGFGWADPAKVKEQADLILKYASARRRDAARRGRALHQQFIGKVKLTKAEAAAVSHDVAFRKFVA